MTDQTPPSSEPRDPDRPLTLTIDRGLATINFCQPPANALGSALIAALTEALDEIERADAGAVVICSSVPGFFAAGADLKLLSTLDRSNFRRYLIDLRHAIERLATIGPPTIAAIEGYALGGGLELAIACTLRIAQPSARLGVPEVKLGLLPGAGGTQRLPPLIGRGPALDLLLTGRTLDAAESERVGLLDLVVEDGDVIAEAERIGRAYVDGPTEALSAIIRCVDAARDLPLPAGMEIEADAVLGLFETDEATEGISAFLEKRPPRFSTRGL